MSPGRSLARRPVMPGIVMFLVRTTAGLAIRSPSPQNILLVPRFSLPVGQRSPLRYLR